MSVIARSVGNALRNKVRTSAVVVILAVAIGLALSMLVANQAVAAKVTSLKASVGNNLTVNPAGARGGIGGGEPLTGGDVAKASAVPHVTSVTGSLTARLSNAAAATDAAAAGTTGAAGGPGGRMGASGTTSLTSAVDPGTLGNRQNSSSGTTTGGTGNAARPSFTIPVSATGISGSLTAAGEAINVTSGSDLNDFSDASTQALVGTTLAEKNSLQVGSTFTVQDRTMTVAGIFDAGTAFDNNAIYVSLAAAQTLLDQAGEISTMTVTVDSIENVDATKTAVAAALGTTRVDVTSGGQNLESAVSSLGTVQNISLIGFIAALITAGLIVLLIMIMVVRERRREIGVLKAIGASNRTIGVQFVLEAMVLVVMGSVVGAVVAAVSSNSIVSALVAGNTTTSTTTGGRFRGTGTGAPQAIGEAAAGGVPGGGNFGGGAFAGANQLIGTISTSVGWQTLVLGVVGILVIAAVGALVPALLTAKVRPIEVLRGE
ncbi:ABC transporter permease [Arthrobacter sp. 35W]|uniref:ABC transporter permease n=1 Tax=Arthrobacter sp. 35W TaxID=1132441 RepID=UPI00040CB343|nr:FtsX-like permease family protein [Arthrobacter sp. 35W]